MLVADDVMLSTRVEAHMQPVKETVRPNASFLTIVERALDSSGSPVYVTGADGSLRGVVHLEHISVLIQ